MMLSVLIPTIPDRVDRFTLLYNDVMAQVAMIKSIHPTLGDVEVLVNSDPRFLDGGPSIGEKRHELVQRAQGKYLCFLDDDDTISPNYIESLLRLCSMGQSICTFRVIVKMESFWASLDMRLSYKVNDQLTPEYEVRRPPWHICPVRTKYAQLYAFNHKNNAEDFEWMEKVLTHCTTEAHTDKVLFQYNHGPHSEADKIPL